MMKTGIEAYRSNRCTCLYPKRATISVKTAMMMMPTLSGSVCESVTEWRALAPAIVLMTLHLYRVLAQVLEPTSCRRRGRTRCMRCS